MIRDELRNKNRKQLESLAKKNRVAGWHALAKSDLIEAILRASRVRKVADTRSERRLVSRRLSRKTSDGHARNGATTRSQRNGSAASHGSAAGKNGKAGARRTKPKARRNHGGVPRRLVSRILPTVLNGHNGSAKDGLIAHVRDPHWIHVQWALTPRILERAAAALGSEWHESVPVIRVFDVTSEDGTQGANSWVQDIEIHGGVDNWYVPVANPPRSYEMHLGYRAASGQFFVLARSRKVHTPQPGSIADAANGMTNGTHSGNGSHHGNGAHPVHLSLPQLPNGKHSGQNGCFEFQIQTELIVHGSTHPNARLTLLGEHIPLTKDGKFSLRLTLPDGRQVIPAVATAPDGAEQRTIVLGVERNTKELEPLLIDEPLN